MKRFLALTSTMRVLVVASCGLALTWGGWAIIRQGIPKPAKPGTLPFVAKELKSRGIHSHRLPAPIIPYYPELVGGFDQFVADCDAVVVATMTDMRYRMSGDLERIETIAKFRIDDFLAGTIRRSRGQIPSDRLPRAARSLAPLQEEEILLLLEGGTLTVNGVRLQQGSYGFPSLSVGKQYLLFLSAVRPQLKVDNYYGSDQLRLYSTSAGPSGVYAVEADGLSAFKLKAHGLANPNLQKELDERFSSQKDRVVGHVKRVGRAPKIESVEGN